MRNRSITIPPSSSLEPRPCITLLQLCPKAAFRPRTLRECLGFSDDATHPDEELVLSLIAAFVLNPEVIRSVRYTSKFSVKRVDGFSRPCSARGDTCERALGPTQRTAREHRRELPLEPGKRLFEVGFKAVERRVELREIEFRDQCVATLSRDVRTPPL